MKKEERKRVLRESARERERERERERDLSRKSLSALIHELTALFTNKSSGIKFEERSLSPRPATPAASSDQL